MKVITIANQKGGIGKTTTATCMASILNNMGYKTLLIDTDVQCNSTDFYRAQSTGVATLYDLILDDDPCTIEEAIQHTEAGDIIASDKGLKEADQKAGSADTFFLMKDMIDGLTGYDFVIIDTNPMINVMLNNALVASDLVIIPMTADRFAMQGLGDLTSSISAVQNRLNRNLKISGLLLVKFSERTLVSRDVRASLAKLAESIGTSLYSTYIRESVKCREAHIQRTPLIKYAPNSTTEKDYEAFVNEFLAKEVNNGQK